jgi:hypothetical protein
MSLPWAGAWKPEAAGLSREEVAVVGWEEALTV